MEAMVETPKSSPKTDHKFIPPEVILSGISHDIRRTLTGISYRIDDLEKSIKNTKREIEYDFSHVLSARQLLRTLSQRLSKIVDEADEHEFANFEEFFQRINDDVGHPLRELATDLGTFPNTDLRGASNVPDGFDPRYRLRLQGIATSISRTRRALLALSRFADVNRRIEYQPINISTEIEDRIQTDLVGPLRKSNRKWDAIHVSGEATIQTSQFALASIIGNILTNAVVHGRRKNIDISVKIRLVELSELQATFTEAFKKVRGPQNWATIEICDTGYGIPPKDRDTVFDLFVQSNARRANRQGDGVGLSLVVYALDQLGGSIELRSTVNIGTCFLVVLPDGKVEGRQPKTILGSSDLQGH